MIGARGQPFVLPIHFVLSPSSPSSPSPLSPSPPSLPSLSPSPLPLPSLLPLFPPPPLPSSQAQKKLQEEELSHLRQLKDLGVDLTAYLVSQHPKPDQVLRVITLGTGGNVHIHP